jgi:competence protein ComEC
VPWPWGLALGVVVGVLCATSGATRGTAGLVAAVAAAACAAALAARLPASADGGRRALAWAVAIGLVAGAWRASAWMGAPDPWAGRAGERLEVEAVVVDGVAWPVGAPGLLLRGGAVEDGRLRLVGRLAALPGRRNPGGFDARAHHARRGVTTALTVESATTLAPPGARLRARAALHAGVTAGLAPPAAALMQALTLGLRDDLGPIRDAFAASGLAHVLALSGLHVGLLAAVLTLAVGGVGRRRSALVVGVLLGYVAVVGASPAVVRATAMVAATLLGRAFGVGGAGWGSHLALAAALSLLARPAWLGDLGFQLSYLSVWGMGMAAAPVAGWMGRWSWRRPGGATLRLAARSGGARARTGAAGAAAARWARTAAAVSITAQWATGSLVASSFGAIPLLAPLTNLVAVPLAAALVPLGFAAGLLGLVHPGAAAALNGLTGPLAAALLGLADVAARAPSLPWGEVSALGHAAFAVGSLGLLAALRGTWRPWRGLTVAGAAGLVTVLVPPPWGTPDLIALDVGQGDAVVVRLARGQAVLVDGGGTPFSDFDVGARTVVPALRALGIGTLPVVVATHADVDHIEGLVAVLRAFPVGTLMIGHRAPERAAFVALMEVAEERGVHVLEVRRGETYRVGGSLGLEVLHPTQRSSGEPNEDSVALLLRWRGDPWALLLGDLPAHVEAALAVPPTPLLLAPHHGSASSTSEHLLRAAQPRWAFVSVGDNRYGHPAPSVLARLDAHGVAVRTTRADGALRAPFPVAGPP